MKLRTLLAAMAAALLAACADPASVEVSAKEYGNDWPFKAATATLRCTDRARMVIVDGVAYALNGPALRAGLPHPANATEILKDPNRPPGGVFTERAGTLCAK